MTDEICEIIITAPDADWLAAFTTELVGARLCACGHNAVPIRSIYRWAGAVHDEVEARVALHTRRSLVAKIVEFTQSRHPDEVPCVIATPIIAGNQDYLDWVLSETDPADTDAETLG